MDLPIPSYWEILAVPTAHSWVSMARAGLGLLGAQGPSTLLDHGLCKERGQAVLGPLPRTP